MKASPRPLYYAYYHNNMTGLGKFPKISPKTTQVRFCTGYVEVITIKFEPHLNHASCNLLIINEFNILHRQVTTSRFFGNILDVLKLNHISRILPGQKSAPSPAWFTYPNWLQSILVLPMVLSIFVWECP